MSDFFWNGAEIHQKTSIWIAIIYLKEKISFLGYVKKKMNQ
jgi:hypothetical protein